MLERRAALLRMLANGATLDWSLVEGEPQREVALDQVELPRPVRTPRVWWSPAAEAVGLAQLAFVAFHAPLALSPSSAAIPTWMYLVNAVFFGGIAAILLAGGRQDRRLGALGTLFLLIGAAFARPVIVRVGGETGWLDKGLLAITADAFLAAALWRFVWVFPKDPSSRATRRVGALFAVLTGATGTVLVAANLVRSFPGAGGVPVVSDLLRALNRDDPLSAYWLLAFGPAVLAFPYLTWKSLRETPAEWQRVKFLLLALTIGIAPFACAVVASIPFPVLSQPPWRQLIGVFIYAALASVVPATAYAVLVERVMELRLAIARVTQWRFARHCVWTACLAPLAYLLVDLYVHRDVTLTAYLASGSAAGLFLLLFVWFSTLTFRHQILNLIDKWFRADRAGRANALARLEQALRGARTMRETTDVLALALGDTIHATSSSVLLVGEAGDQLLPVTGAAPPLDATSVLVDLVRSAGPDIRLQFTGNSPLLLLLPAIDRAWLSAGRVEQLAPLRASTGTLFGLVALGPTRHDLPYTIEDHGTVRSMCALVATRLENLWLRDRRSSEVEAAPMADCLSLIGKNEPAECCPKCSRVWPAVTKRCPCGAATEAAALPLLLTGKFQLERRLGSGGMGVVYLASDLSLGRRVALKTLPRLSAALAKRLQREARAMAAVLHPNLAQIYAVDQWRDRPVLVVEYLDGGTLADSLRRATLSVEETLRLGVLMADVLDHLHCVGILHRDVKPSNIGYTLNGTPKLLDLGLSVMAEAEEDQPGAEMGGAGITVHNLAGGSGAGSDSRQLFGTLRYMSPEALDGESPGPSFDLWALGLVLYEALTGHHPIGDEPGRRILRRIRRADFPDVRDRCPACPPAFAAFFRDALSPSPERRPATAHDFRIALQALRSAS